MRMNGGGCRTSVEVCTLRLAIPQKGPLIKTPMVTESGVFPRTELTRVFGNSIVSDIIS